VVTRSNQHELPNRRTASGKCCVRSDGHRAVSAACDTARGDCGWSFDAIVAKCGGLYHSGRSESLDVETRSHADQMNEQAGDGGASATFPRRWALIRLQQRQLLL
jgi:hypothetical protein